MASKSSLEVETKGDLASTVLAVNRDVTRVLIDTVTDPSAASDTYFKLGPYLGRLFFSD